MPKLIRTLTLLPALTLCVCAYAQLPKPEFIKPSDADARVKQYDDPSMIARPAKMADVPLVLFMPGTGGRPGYSPMMRLITEEGYPVINLEYNDEPAVNQTCPRVPDPDCAGNFREMRLYGTGASKEIHNPVAESIAVRLSALLQLLAKRHPDEHWDRYLDTDGSPKWSRIIVSGQSQGAGMAAFIAKQHEVARVVLFSSPIDSYSFRQTPASWLTWPSKTPLDRWYAMRNSREAFNDGLVRTYPILKIPADHIRVFTLDLPARMNPNAKNPYHTINVRDPRYTPEWKFLYGSATGN